MTEKILFNGGQWCMDSLLALRERNEIAHWLASRLHGKDELISRSEDIQTWDRPHLLVRQLMGRSNLPAKVRDEICRCCVGFLREWVNDMEGEWYGDPGMRLFRLAPSVVIRKDEQHYKAVDYVFKLVNSKEIKSNPRLHFTGVQAIVALGCNLPYEFWMETFNNDPDQYATVVIPGLATDGLGDLERFVDEIGLTDAVVDSLCVHAPRLMDRFQREDFRCGLGDKLKQHSILYEVFVDVLGEKKESLGVLVKSFEHQ